MKKIINLALGVCALSVASLAASPEASAATWGPSVGPNSGAGWWDYSVWGGIYTGSTWAAYATSTSNTNPHIGGYYMQCVGRDLAGWPVGGTVTWYGSATRYTNYCPNNGPLSYSFGWVSDN